MNTTTSDTHARENRLCANCSSDLKGPYCYRCGQPARSFIKFFPALAHEMADEVLAYDSRMWRTLRPLIFSPGFLSREYIFGKRVRYTSPFRLYIVISLLAFLMVGFLVEGMDISVDNSDGNVSITLYEDDIPQYTDYAWLNLQIEKIEQNARIVENDPGRFLRVTMSMLPQMMFVLLPLFAIIMSLFYLFAKRYYVEHLVLLAHNHAFIFMTMLLTGLLTLLRSALLTATFPGSGLLAGLLFGIVTALWLWVPIYLFISMKRFYQQGWILTTLKYLTLATIYFILFSLAATVVIMLGILRI